MTARLGPYCSAPGCTEPAEGAVLLAYVKERRAYLCAAHLETIRRELARVLHGTEEREEVHV